MRDEGSTFGSGDALAMHDGTPSGESVYVGGNSSLRMSLTEAWSPGLSEFRQVTGLPEFERLEVYQLEILAGATVRMKT